MHRRIAPLLALILLIAPVPGSTTAATTLPSPVAHWGFDEASGSTLVDESGNGRDGSFTGQVSRVDDGVYDRALRLHLSSTSVTAEAAGFASAPITVSVWVRSSTTPSSGAVIFEKGARSCGEPTFGMYVDGTGLEVKLMDRLGSVASARLQVDLGLWDGDWHHVSFTHGDLYGLRIYVDGKTWGMAHGWLTINYGEETIDQFAFGSSAAGSSCDVPAYIGDLEEIRIYDRPLDQNQIGALEPPISTETTLTPRSDAQAYVRSCWTANVDPAPGGGGALRISELLTDGREVDIGLAINDYCVHGGPLPPPGTYLVPLSFDTKGTHHIRARFIPGDPWQPSTSAWLDQAVAGVPTTTYIQIDPATAGHPIDVWAGVVGSDTFMTGSIALYDITSSTPTHLETKAIPVTGGIGGSVTFQLPGRPAGTYRLEARYLGDSDVFEPSSTAADLTVADSVGPPPDTTPPTATAPSHRLIGATSITRGRVPFRIAWSGADAGSGIARYELGQRTDGGAWTAVATTLTSPTLDRALTPGHTYQFRVRAIDNADNAGGWMTGPALGLSRYIETSSRIRYSGTWALTRSTVYWGGQAKFSRNAGATASISATGRSFAWVARKGPTRGKAQVYVNGVLKATVDLRASTYQNQRVVWAANYSTSATRTITIRVLGTSGRPRIDLDAIVVGS